MIVSFGVPSKPPGELPSLQRRGPYFAFCGGLAVIFLNQSQEMTLQLEYVRHMTELYLSKARASTFDSPDGYGPTF